MSSSADPSLIRRVRQIMARFDLSQLEVMHQSGVSNSVLCLWLQNKYRGDNAKVNARLLAWLNYTEGMYEKSIGQVQLDNHQNGYHNVWTNPALLENANTIGGNATLIDSVTSSRYPALASIVPPSNPHVVPQTTSSFYVSQLSASLLKDWQVAPAFPVNPTFNSSSTASSNKLPSLPFLGAPMHARYNMATQDERKEILVPIRFDCTIGAQKFEDAFLWNISQTFITPRQFIRQTLDDLNLPFSYFAPLLQQFKSQLGHYRLQETKRKLKRDREKENEPDNAMEECKTQEETSIEITNVSLTKSKSKASTHFVKPSKRFRGNRLIRIRLDITLHGLRLRDSFLWNPTNNRSDCERFANILASELGLSGEWYVSRFIFPLLFQINYIAFHPYFYLRD